MTHPYINNSQSWCFALRQLMSYPSFAPSFHTIAWCASGPRNLLQAVETTKIAADMGRDLIHVAFALGVTEPFGISLAVREGIGMEWIPGARLYAASESGKIELLAGDRRWFIGPRHILTTAKLPRKYRRSKGEQVAMRRWRQAAVVARGLG